MKSFIMEGRPSAPLLYQTKQQTCYTWIGYSPGDRQEHFAGQTYGFKLAARDMLVAVADAATDNTGYLHKGREWNSETENQGGRYFQYFSLVFRIGQDSRA